MAKGRVPMQVSPKFKDMLKDLKRKMSASGRDISLRDLTEEIASIDSVNILEEKIIQKKIKDINLRLDRRGR